MTKRSFYALAIFCATSLLAIVPSNAHYYHHHHRHHHLPTLVYLSVPSAGIPYYYYSPYTVVADVLVHQTTLVLPK